MQETSVAKCPIIDEDWRTYILIEIWKCVQDYNAIGVNSGYAKKQRKAIKEIEELVNKYGEWQRGNYI